MQPEVRQPDIFDVMLEAFDQLGDNLMEALLPSSVAQEFSADGIPTTGISTTVEIPARENQGFYL